MAVTLTKAPGTTFSRISRPGVGQAALGAVGEGIAAQQSQAVAQAMRSGQPISQSQVAQAATQQTAALGKAQAQATTQESQRALQAQSATGQQRQMDLQASLRNRALELKRQERGFQQNLYGLNSELAKDIFEKQTQFTKDELGRTVWQTRQLIDWAVAKSRSDEEVAEFEQNLTMAYQRKMQMMKTAHAKLTQLMEQQFLSADAEKDKELKRTLAKLKADAEAKMQKEQAEAAMWATVLSEGAGIIAGVTTAATGNVAAAPAAYMAGKAGGTLLAGAVL